MNPQNPQGQGQYGTPAAPQPQPARGYTPGSAQDAPEAYSYQSGQALHYQVPQPGQMAGTQPLAPHLQAKTNPNSTQNMRRKRLDRKSTRLNSSHTVISYAVVCLEEKK